VDFANDHSASGASRRQGEVENPTRTDSKAPADHVVLSPETGHRTSGAMPALFDMELRARRRDRAARSGPELFLFERVFADCLDRIALMPRRFEKALLIGSPDSGWPKRLGALVGSVDVRDPGPLFAASAGGAPIVEDAWKPPNAAYDLVLAIGTFDTINDLPRALRSMFLAMRPGGLFIGAVSGGDTLPQLRGSMRAADLVTQSATPHVHPRIEAAAVSPLLSQAGLTMPVVDVDRIRVSYPSLRRLIADLRAMGVTNILEARSRRGLSKAAFASAAAAFEGDRVGGTTEVFEILHFAAWAPARPG
jgi:NADH dehydrogenase [ubiquinone] 1 alpha subcomplex assembly factor 5